MRRMYSKNQLELQTEELLSSGVLPSVKADEILENMEGYSFVKATAVTNLEIEHVYASVVKTGNKITFVSAMNFTRTGTVNENQNMGYFKMPASIGSKLIPSQIGSIDYLDVRQVTAEKTGWELVDMPVYVRKTDDTQIGLSAGSGGLVNLTLNTKYYCRYEVTFLLSDNMVTD